VNIVSEDPYKSGRVRQVRVDLAPPLSLELAGELAVVNEGAKDHAISDLIISPDDYSAPTDIDPLQNQNFSYFVRAAAPDPTDNTVKNGFDELLIVTPQVAELRGVRLGSVSVSTVPSLEDPDAELTAAVSTRFDTYFERNGAGSFLNESGVELIVAETAADSLWLRFPTSINGNLNADDHALVEVQFVSRSFREGIEYGSFVRSSNGEKGVFQRVDTASRDATELVNSSTARVSLVPLGSGLVQDVSINSFVTPNGDQANDELLVEFTLLKMIEERPVAVEIFDLSGRLIATAENRRSQGLVGNQEFRWNGKSLTGKLVAPGMYVCRIIVEADHGDSQFMRIVNVAY